MTLKEKIKQMEALEKKTENFRRNIIPVKAGNLAVNHFQGNFLKSGYQDGALVKWKTTVRQKLGGGSAAAQYGPLTSATNRLKNAFYYQTGDMRVTVENTAPYASYQNEGATAKVTARMKAFAWHKYFEAAAGGGWGKGKAAAGADYLLHQSGMPARRNGSCPLPGQRNNRHRCPATGALCRY
jgi:hypothetical protein